MSTTEEPTGQVAGESDEVDDVYITPEEREAAEERYRKLLEEATMVREYNGEKKLIIGCGNGPESWCPCCVPEDFDPERYRKKHLHSDAYTIDTNPDMNPSAIGNIVTQTFEFIPDGAFDEIIFEGLCIYYREVKQIMKVLKRLMSKHARVEISVIAVGSYRFRGAWTNYYRADPFINWWELRHYDPRKRQEVLTDNEYVVEFAKVYRRRKNGELKLIDDIKELDMERFWREYGHKNMNKILVQRFGQFSNGSFFPLLDHKQTIDKLFMEKMQWM